MKDKEKNPLVSGDKFHRRHIGPRETDIKDMLDYLELGSLEQLTEKAVPKAIRAEFPKSVLDARSEQEVLSDLSDLASLNQINKSMIGMGYYGTYTPPVILRNILENPGWYTAYTPYQPEISQGRLEALLAFQTMIMDLTGMETANASLLDEATAAAEAMSMSHGVTKNIEDRYFVSDQCHPQTISVLRTRASAVGIEIVVGDHQSALIDESYFGALLQYPSSNGEVYDYREFIKSAHKKGLIVTVAADLLSLVLLVPPGEFGADIVVGSAQRFGVPMGFGGPHAAFFATHDKYKRSMPGRIVGVSVDSSGQTALRLALQTREQHIRREKATSNICTAQVLLAVIAAMYAIYHGPVGLRKIAERVNILSSIFVVGLNKIGVDVITKNWFDTVTVECSGDVDKILELALKQGINLRKNSSSTIGISFDETTDPSDIEKLLMVFSGGTTSEWSIEELQKKVCFEVPRQLQRESPILQHALFNTQHSETQMLRYMRGLELKDIALNQSMIPLGSCTMKLNSTAEMIPVTWPGFANIHPFTPSEQVVGYMEMIDGLERMLCEVTGFSVVSLQPNAGSQGEYAGLLAIRGFHSANGETDRDICLIPNSAHGTNPASAVMAGLKVIVVDCDENGNVDLSDLKSKVRKYNSRLAALMVTYPSTHGVFEEAIVDICEIVHSVGGQVYLDGANLNALLGVSLPGQFGPDVAHMNLHKTFCIPHGGGGPGVGPIGARKHLAPYLPSHPLAESVGVGPVSAAPWGSAGILPISWAYIAMMGAEGLKKATQVAILNANYIAKKLSSHYPVLYKGQNGCVAHECIIDVRPLKDSVGISVEDIAKRLMDYGFHAPTMSFPVIGTLMIEPTESEPKSEIDRFCDAMIAIRGEIHRIEKGEWQIDDNPLSCAPHTLSEVAGDKWQHKYTREEAAFPMTYSSQDLVLIRCTEIGI